MTGVGRGGCQLTSRSGQVWCLSLAHLLLMATSSAATPGSSRRWQEAYTALQCLAVACQGLPRAAKGKFEHCHSVTTTHACTHAHPALPQGAMQESADLT